MIVKRNFCKCPESGLLYIAVIFTALITTTRCANILGVFMYPSYSHQKVFQAIWKELSLSGHNVTILTPNPLNDTTLTNLTEVSLNSAYDVLKKHNVQKSYSKDLYSWQVKRNGYDILEVIVEHELNNKQFKESILNSNSRFDLILIQQMHPIWFALGERFNAPVISMYSMNTFCAWYDTVGNPNHPILFPDLLFNFPPGKPTFLEKIESVYYFLWHKWYYYNIILPKTDRTLKIHFPDIRHPIKELKKRISMFFVNRNLMMHPPKPNLPTVIDMSPVHIKPPKPLPEDLKKILDSAVKGVIYVSFGSNIKSVRFELEFRNNIVWALSDLPYTVLLKWETDSLPGNPKNIIIKKWFPQIDLLAHRNVKVFVTHGGQQSVEEAISREVPLIGIPFYMDQSGNTRRIVEMGIGEAIDPNKLSKNVLRDAIMKVAENKTYKKKIHEVRSKLWDKPISGLESVVWWSEYTIRYKGTQHLKNLSVDMSWAEYLFLDIILLLNFLTILLIYIIYKLLLKLLLALHWNY